MINNFCKYRVYVKSVWVYVVLNDVIALAVPEESSLDALVKGEDTGTIYGGPAAHYVRIIKW